MTDRWKQLLAADPSTRSFEPAPGLLEEIRQVPIQPSAGRPSRVWRRLSRGAGVILAVLFIGGTVSWATTGVSPIDHMQRIWGIDRNADLSVDESGFGLDRFSVLKPMTQDGFDEMPERLKFWLALAQSHPKKPPPGPRDESWRPGLVQAPRELAGWGMTKTDGGETVAVVSMNRNICMVYDRFHGGGCEPVRQIARRGMTITANPGGDQPRTMLGLVTDDVATLRFERRAFGEIPLRDNVFDVTGLPVNRSYILGLDKDGAVVTRIFVSRELDHHGASGWMPVGPQPKRETPQPAG